MAIQFPTTDFPVLHTPRLVCRELTEADGNQSLAIRNNEDINRFIGRSSTQTLQHVLGFIALRRQDWEDKKSVYWGIVLKETGCLIGTICFWNLDYAVSTAEIGYELLPAEQGKGLMKEAIDNVLAYGFEIMKLSEITACLLPANVRSLKLLENHGFIYAETIENEVVYKLSHTQWLNHQH